MELWTALQVLKWIPNEFQRESQIGVDGEWKRAPSGAPLRAPVRAPLTPLGLPFIPLGIPVNPIGTPFELHWESISKLEVQSTTPFSLFSIENDAFSCFEYISENTIFSQFLNHHLDIILTSS